MHTSGLVLDVYDDALGEQLKLFFNSPSDVPGFVKQAHAISPSDHGRLPDDAFALVMVNEGEKLRKYACIDEGNTALSVLYFLKNAHKLPDEARVRTAENLKVASGWYGLDVPAELEKEAGLASKLEATKKERRDIRVANMGRNTGAVYGSLVGDLAGGVIGAGVGHAIHPMHAGAGALIGTAAGALGGMALGGHLGKKWDDPEGAAKARAAYREALHKSAGIVTNMAINHVKNDPIGTALTVATAPALIRGTKQGISSNLASVRQGEYEGGIGGGMERLAEAFKFAELSGTATMPISKDPVTEDDAGPEHTIKKTSTAGRLVQGHRGETSVLPEVAPGVAGKNPEKLPQHMNPVVDVTGKEPRKESTEKKASRYAMPSYGKYPLDSYEQVKKAAAYFGDYCDHMEPVDRHEFCVNLVKRASELSIPLEDRARKYGSETYAPHTEIKTAFAMRRSLLQDPAEMALLDKVAQVLPTLHPSDFVAVLEEFDKTAGLHHHYDSHVYDPYYSTFGFTKTAEEDSATWSDVVGNYHVTGRELENCALSQFARLQKQFGEDFATEFKKDPIGIYKSMPVEQKILIIRIATENAPV